MRRSHWLSIFACALPLLAAAAPLPRFPPGAFWNQDVSRAPLAANSASMVSTLQGLGGWGAGDDFQIDFSMYVLQANAASPTVSVVAWPKADDYYAPDCDAPGFAFPFPPAGRSKTRPVTPAITRTPTVTCSCSRAMPCTRRMRRTSPAPACRRYARCAGI